MRSILHPRPKPESLLRLFCLPYAGGGASIFAPWARFLPKEAELCCIQLPGRENRLGEAPCRNTNSCIESIGPAVISELDRPYAIFGHSNGALLAFELVRSLRRQGKRLPECLMVSASRAPHIPRRDPPIHHLPDAQFIEEVRRFNGTRQEVFEHAELLSLVLPVLRADLEINETYGYHAEAALECPIVAYAGSEDALVHFDEVDAWRAHTADRFEIVSISGDHFFLHSAQEPLLAHISQRLLQQITSHRP